MKMLLSLALASTLMLPSLAVAAGAGQGPSQAPMQAPGKGISPMQAPQQAPGKGAPNMQAPGKMGQAPMQAPTQAPKMGQGAGYQSYSYQPGAAAPQSDYRAFSYQPSMGPPPDAGYQTFSYQPAEPNYTAYGDWLPDTAREARTYRNSVNKALGNVE